MNSSLYKLIARQVPIRWIGTFRQLFGGASTWITLAVLAFTAITAWNTPTAMIIREYIPWLNLGVFMSIIVLVMVVAVWVEHKFVQPAIMLYWNKMHFTHGNPQQKQLDRIEKKIDELLKAESSDTKEPDNISEHEQISSKT